MLRTFNCGIGLVMVAAPERVTELMHGAGAHGITCYDIGEVVAAGSAARVEYVS